MPSGTSPSFHFGKSSISIRAIFQFAMFLREVNGSQWIQVRINFSPFFLKFRSLILQNPDEIGWNEVHFFGIPFHDTSRGWDFYHKDKTCLVRHVSCLEHRCPLKGDSVSGPSKWHIHLIRHDIPTFSKRITCLNSPTSLIRLGRSIIWDSQLYISKQNIDHG